MKAGAKAGVKGKPTAATTNATSKPAVRAAAKNAAVQKLLKLLQTLKLKLVRPCVGILVNALTFLVLLVPTAKRLVQANVQKENKSLQDKM